MQYSVVLPAAFDMAVIRRRVAERGRLMDDFPGLGFKAYGIRERGVDGSPVNAYAPLYVWHTIAGMNAFLWGDGFAGIRRDFGRPEVLQWPVAGLAAGPAREEVPSVATRSTTPLGVDDDPRAAVEAAVSRMTLRATIPAAHTVVVGMDARRWELVELGLWAQAAPPGTGERFEVLHLSAPGL